MVTRRGCTLHGRQPPRVRARRSRPRRRGSLGAQRSPSRDLRDRSPGRRPSHSIRPTGAHCRRSRRARSNSTPLPRVIAGRAAEIDRTRACPGRRDARVRGCPSRRVGEAAAGTLDRGGTLHGRTPRLVGPLRRKGRPSSRRCGGGSNKTSVDADDRGEPRTQTERGARRGRRFRPAPTGAGWRPRAWRPIRRSARTAPRGERTQAGLAVSSGDANRQNPENAPVLVFAWLRTSPTDRLGSGGLPREIGGDRPRSTVSDVIDDLGSAAARRAAELADDRSGSARCSRVRSESQPPGGRIASRWRRS